MKKILLALLLLPALAFGQAFSVWAPGGDLSTSSTFNNQIIAAGAVTLAKMGLMPANSLICNATGSSATGQYCTSLPASFGVPTISGTPTTGHCTDWISPTQIGDAGAACGSGSGGVTPSGTPAQYQIPVWASASSILGIATGTVGQALVSGGASAYPSFSASLPGVTSVNGTAIPLSSTVLSNGSTGSGAIVLANGASVANTAITGATIDNTTSADGLLFTDLQASALVGTVPAASIPPSSVRYSAAATCSISSTDNGNVVTSTYVGAQGVCTIPDINTSGINPNAFQMAIFNYDVNELLLNRTTSTTINNLSSIPFAPGAAAILFADAANSGTGVYNYDALITGESVGPQPMYLFHDTAQSGTNISDWGLGTISGTNGQFCIYALKDGGYSPGFASGGTGGICLTRGASGSTSGQGIPTITIGSAASGTGTSFPGGGLNAFSGNVRAPLFLINGSSLGTTTGQSFIYQPASNQIGFGGVPSGTPTEYGYFNAAGSLVQLFDSYVQEASPRSIWQDTNESSNTNLEVVQFSYATPGVLSIGSLTDTFGAGYSAFSATRGASGSTTGIQWVSETFGCAACATTYQFYGNATFNNQVKAADIVVNGSTLGATGTVGIYNPTGTQLGFFTNGVAAGYIDGNQNLNLVGSVVSGGTAPTLSTVSGCTSLSTATGGSRTFSFTQTSATTGVCAFTITWPAAQAAPNGFVCNGSEASQGTTLFQTNTANHTTYVTMKTGATTASGDFYVVHCDAF